MKVRIAKPDGQTDVHNGIERIDFIDSGRPVGPLQTGVLLVNMSQVVTIRILDDKYSENATQ